MKLVQATDCIKSPLANVKKLNFHLGAHKVKAMNIIGKSNNQFNLCSMHNKLITVNMSILVHKFMVMTCEGIIV